MFTQCGNCFYDILIDKDDYMYILLKIAQIDTTYSYDKKYVINQHNEARVFTLRNISKLSLRKHFCYV